VIYNIYLSVIACAFLCSLISFRLHYPFHLRLFSVLIGIAFLTEILAKFGLNILHLHSNYPVYSVYLLAQYLVYALYFKRILEAAWLRNIINVFMVVLGIAWLFTTFFVFGVSVWNSYIIFLGDLFAIVMCCFYFYSIFSSDKLLDFRKSPEFWTAAGIFIYSCCEVPIAGVLNFMDINYPALTMDLEIVLQMLNILMYIIFIYAYVCPLLTNTTKS